MSKIRYTMLIGALLLALVLSAFNTTSAFADENTPPSETTEETTNQETESAETEEIVEETESPPNEEEATQPTGESESDTEEESNPIEEILEQLPEGTEVVVLDENGEPVSLATQQAEEAFSSADPMWCPAGAVPPKGCSPSFDYFVGPNGLIEWLIENQGALGKAGTIWISANYDSSVNEIYNPVDIILNGEDLSVMANYALTIQGGWTQSGKSISSTDPFSEFNVPLRIINWNAPVTINNISVNGVNPIDSPENDYALQVHTKGKGNIVLNNVEVVDNEVTVAGAYLTNYLATKPALVTINNSDFSSNSAVGIYIASRGVVTLNNINANDNDDIGALIDNTFDVKAQAVNLTGTNNFNYNGKDGLKVYSMGVITLNYINASYNTGGSGVYVDNCLQSTPGLSGCANTFASAVNLKGTNVFSYNGWDGLRVYSNGAITVTNIIATNNGTDPNRDGDTPGIDYDAYGKGVFLNNFGALAKPAVNVTGTNYFSDNISNGLFVISKGMIKLNNITANKNDCDQIKEGDDIYCAGVYLESYGGVTQTGYANFSENDQDGLRITTYNVPVTLINIFAYKNGNDGVEINGGNESPKSNITINGTNISNNNSRYGIWIYTSGAITLSNVTANHNTNSGLILDNRLGATASPITLKGVNTFQGNGDTGLTVNSRGAITANNITSVENTGQAAIFDNCDEGPAGVCQAYPATTTKGVVTKTHGIKIQGTNYFSKNGNGLLVNSRGVIAIANLTSVYNNGEGVVINNNYTNAIGGVTISGTNNISNNQTYGMEINTFGAVSIANITANNNNISGVTVTNTGNPAKPANVNFTGTNRFNDNNGTGLVIYSHGVVTLNNITANENGDIGNGDTAKGVLIDNASDSTIAKAVAIKGVNNFNNNNDTGLYITSKGAITVQKVTANYNNGKGVYLNNEVEVLYGTAAVTVSGYGIFLGNAENGLEIKSSGAVTAANLTANNNSVNGVSIETHYDKTSTTSVNVAITGLNNFNANNNTGLIIKTDGTITLSNVYASSNGENGAFLDNNEYTDGELNKTIVLNGVNNFLNNGNHGLEFNANGNVTLNRLTAFSNDLIPGGFAGSGIVGVFSANTSKKNLIYNCGSVMGNETFGLDISGAEAITIKGVMLGQTNEFYGFTPTITRACPLQ